MKQNQKQPPEVFYKNGRSWNSRKILSEACKFIKKETPIKVYFCEFCEIFKNTFFTEHLRVTFLRNDKRCTHPFMKFIAHCTLS